MLKGIRLGRGRVEKVFDKDFTVEENVPGSQEANLAGGWRTIVVTASKRESEYH